MNPNTYVGLAILGRWRNTAGAYFDALAKLLADREKFMPPGKPASADVLDFMDRSFDTFENACRRFADVNLELTQFCNVNLSLIHISEPTRQAEISYAVF